MTDLDKEREAESLGRTVALCGLCRDGYMKPRRRVGGRWVYACNQCGGQAVPDSGIGPRGFHRQDYAAWQECYSGFGGAYRFEDGRPRFDGV